jgi:hypothetical protein
MNDWRLQGQEKFLNDVVLQRKKYQRFREGWDHDHCEFCGAKFSLEIPDSHEVGFATLDNYHWICDSCFHDFKDLFRWKVQSSSTSDIIPGR